MRRPRRLRCAAHGSCWNPWPARAQGLHADLQGLLTLHGPRACPLHLPHACTAELVKPGAYLTLTDAKVDMYRGSMRLALGAGSKVEASDAKGFDAKVRRQAAWAPPSLSESLCECRWRGGRLP